MPGKLIRIPGLSGLYYRRKRGGKKTHYHRGKRYQKYSPAVDKVRRARRGRRKHYAHEGDYRGKRV